MISRKPELTLEEIAEGLNKPKVPKAVRDWLDQNIEETKALAAIPTLKERAVQRIAEWADRNSSEVLVVLLENAPLIQQQARNWLGNNKPSESWAQALLRMPSSEVPGWGREVMLEHSKITLSTLQKNWQDKPTALTLQLIIKHAEISYAWKKDLVTLMSKEVSGARAIPGLANSQIFGAFIKDKKGLTAMEVWEAANTMVEDGQLEAGELAQIAQFMDHDLWQSIAKTRDLTECQKVLTLLYGAPEVQKGLRKFAISEALKRNALELQMPIAQVMLKEYILNATKRDDKCLEALEFVDLAIISREEKAALLGHPDREVRLQVISRLAAQTSAKKQGIRP